MAGKRPTKLDAFARVLPILGWLPTYEPKWLRVDAIAGLTLWGILVPEALAYAAMADAPLQAGLYALLGSLVVYAILGTTRQAVSAPTSGSSVMMAAVVTPFLVTVPKEFAELLVLLVLVVGIILLLCGLLRLGFVTAFISHSVMTGFLFGLAIHIAVSQAPKLFGLHRSHGETVYQLWRLVEQLSGANWVTFAIGAGAVILLYALEVRAPRAPAPLMIMVAGILAVSVLRLSDEYGVPIVGVMQTGLPAVSMPKVNFDDVLDLMPGAFAIALFILSEALGVGYALGRKYGGDVDPDQATQVDCHGLRQRCVVLHGRPGERLQRVVYGSQRSSRREEPGLLARGCRHGIDYASCTYACFPELARGCLSSDRHPRSGADDEGRRTEALLSVSSGRVRTSHVGLARRCYCRDTAWVGYSNRALFASVQ